MPILHSNSTADFDAIPKGRQKLATSLAAGRVALVTVTLALFTSCTFLAPTPTPMRTIRAPAKPGAHTLIVFLPGRGSTPEDFSRVGFLKIVAESGLVADTVAVDAHLGYYRNHTAVERIKEDVINPARAAGYDRIVLVGISMGGLGAVLYTKEHPQDIAAVILIAPYLGEKPVLDEIGAAGGLATWTPQEPIAESDYQRAIWTWLHGYTNPQTSQPLMYLGFGTEDRFMQSHRLLAEALPPSHVFTAPGAHTWVPWREVFRQILATKLVPPNS